MSPDAVVGLQAANRRWPLLWPHDRDDMRDVGLFQGVLVSKSKETGYACTVVTIAFRLCLDIIIQ